MKKDLVIITAGPNALFQDWGDYSQFDFDVAILNWGNHELRNTEHAAYIEHFVGQKWTIMAAFDQKHDLSNYRYIQCLDDDVLTTPQQIVDTFDFCELHNLDLAQPALTPIGLLIGHPATTVIPGAKMHLITTVEMMCDIHSQRTWKEVIAPCAGMPVGIGFGIEAYWAEVLEVNNGQTKYGGFVAVIDKYPVKHTKPITPVEVMQSRGTDPYLDSKYLGDKNYVTKNWSVSTIAVIADD